MVETFSSEYVAFCLLTSFFSSFSDHNDEKPQKGERNDGVLVIHVETPRLFFCLLVVCLIICVPLHGPCCFHDNSFCAPVPLVTLLSLIFLLLGVNRLQCFDGCRASSVQDVLEEQRSGRCDDSARFCKGLPFDCMCKL